MFNRYLKSFTFAAVSILVVACGELPSSSLTTSTTSQPTTSSAGTSELPSFTLRVWGPSQEQLYLQDVIASFKLLYPSINLNFETAVVGEPDLKSLLLLDVPGGADVFAFPDDQLEDLVVAGALSEVTQFKADVTARNVPWTLEVSTVGDKLYAYPYTADTTTFMYYDTRYITAEEMGSLDSILARAQELNSSVIIDPQGGWAMSGWFTEKGNISWSKITRTQTIDWNNQFGLESAIGMFNAYKTKRIQRDQNIIVTEFLENDIDVKDGILAGVSGNWNAVAIKAVLGENYAAIKLPTFTNGLGEQQQMGSMIGAKLIGVNAYTQNPGLAHAFANYLTNYENQLTKAVTMGVGPSNIAAQEREEVLEIPSIAAAFDQAEFAILQARSVSSLYWTPAGAFADAVIGDALAFDKNFSDWLALPGNSAKTEAQFMTESQIPKLQTYLDAFVTAVLAVNQA